MIIDTSYHFVGKRGYMTKLCFFLCYGNMHLNVKIANIQQRTARMILDKSWDHPSTPLFNEFNWLPLQSRSTYHVALLVFKIHTTLI